MKIRGSFVVYFIISLFLLAAQIGFASGTVTNCTEAELRAAIDGGGTVNFACDGLILLTNTITISENTTLDGSEHLITISGGDVVRLFNVGAGVSLTLKDLTLINGRAVGLDGEPTLDGGEGKGGAILVTGGELSLISCHVSTNHAVGGAGGNGNLDFRGTKMNFGSGGASLAGAIYLDGATLNATNCEFVGNTASGGSGGITAAPIYPIPVKTGGTANGGAIFNHNGTLNLNNCSFSMNKVIGGAAPYIIGDARAKVSGEGMGGALFNDGGDTIVTNCLFVLNNSSSTKSVTTLGGIGATNAGGAIYSIGGDVLIAATQFGTNTVVGGNESEGRSGEAQGGALFNLSQMHVTSCGFIGNRAEGGGYENGWSADGNGGAIMNGGSLQIEQSFFKMNNAIGGHGPTSALGQGGAIYNTNLLTVISSSFERNSAQGLTGEAAFAPPPARGGALFTLQSCYLTNVSFSANTAIGGNVLGGFQTPRNAFGGAIFASGGGTVFLGNCTLSENEAIGGKRSLYGTNGIGFGGGICSTNASVSLINTILAYSKTGSNCFGTLSDLGHNLSSDMSCNFNGPGSLNNTDPKLGPLGDYGGTTPTLPLLSGSPAIDGGDNANSPAADQRGRTRPFGPISDIGAFESSPPYTIIGQISGSRVTTEVSVAAGENMTTTTNNGYFRLTGLVTGAYSVSPMNSNYVFSPSNRLITVGPDHLDVNFKAYQWHALSFEGISNNMAHIVYAGTNGNTVQLLASSNLVDWSGISTNVIGSSNLLDLHTLITAATPIRYFRTEEN